MLNPRLRRGGAAVWGGIGKGLYSVPRRCTVARSAHEDWVSISHIVARVAPPLFSAEGSIWLRISCNSYVLRKNKRIYLLLSNEMPIFAAK